MYMTEFRLLIIRLQLLAKIEEDDYRRMILEEAVRAVIQLADENASLWDMLDEIHASDIRHHNERIEHAMAHLSSLLGDGGGDA